MTGPIRVAVLLCVVSLSGACRTAVDLVALQDAQIAAAVKTALVNDADLGTSAIEVRVASGIALLSGTVPSQALAERAAALARAVDGVRQVDLNLRVGRVEPPGERLPAPPPSAEAIPEFDDDPRLFAIGLSLGISSPRDAAFRSRVAVGPLFRFGSGQGLGTAIALNWFQTSYVGVTSGADESRVRVRPLMAGISYAVASDRITVSPSIVGGMAFNSVNAPDGGVAEGVAVEVDASFIWGPGVSLWFDLNRRAAVNLSVSHVMTRLRVTVLQEGRLVKHGVPGDTTLLHAGVAYKLF